MRYNLFKIHGGKYYLSKWIISKFPEHNKYVECCLGAGNIFYNKPYVPSTLYETNPYIYAVHDQLHQIENAIQSIECSKETFQYWLTQPTDSGLKEYILRKMSRGGLKKDFSTSSRLRGGRPENINSWENSKDLTHYKTLMSKAQLIWGSFEQHEFTDDELIYVDPPYLHETRSTTKEYGDYEWTTKQHENLIDIAKNSPGMWFISGYDSKLYNQLGWYKYTKEVPNHAGQNKSKSKRVECLWTNTI